MLNVKVEAFRPNRFWIDSFKISDRNRTMDEITAAVNDDIQANMPSVRKVWPEVTEIRWEFTEYGQGHYVTVGGEQL